MAGTPRGYLQVGINARLTAEKGGRTFALYTGLVDAAKKFGIVSLTTDIIQMGNETNRNTWIMRAVLVIYARDENGDYIPSPDGSGYLTETYSAIGDANPANVSSAMQSCLPRMAETRSKARCLRDAVNSAMAASEELADDSQARGYESDGGGARPQRSGASRAQYGNAGGGPPRAQAPAPPVEKAPADPNGPASDNQKAAIRSLITKPGYAVALENGLKPMTEESIAAITMAEAGAWIGDMNAKSKKAAAAAS